MHDKPSLDTPQALAGGSEKKKGIMCLWLGSGLGVIASGFGVEMLVERY